MKKIGFKFLSMFMVSIVCTIVFSCSHDDSELLPEDIINPNPPVSTAIPNTTDPSTTETTTNTSTDPSLYNLYQAQAFMHWLNPTDTCSVGYDINPYKELRSKACGVEIERHECNRCRHSSFGVESDKTLNNFVTRRDYSRWHPSDADIYVTCGSHIQEIRAEYKKGLPPNGHIYANVVGGYYTGPNWTVTYHAYQKTGAVTAVCLYEITTKEVKFNEAQNCQICGRTDEVIYKQCKHPSHGIENTVVKSSNTLSKQDVEKQEGKVLGCKTCDHIKFDILNMNEDNDTQLVNKINCLLNNLDSSEISDEDKPGIITELKRLTLYSDLINQNHPELFTKMKEHI